MVRAVIRNLGIVPKNYVQNGNFDFWQRGTSFTASALDPENEPLPADEE